MKALKNKTLSQEDICILSRRQSMNKAKEAPEHRITMDASKCYLTRANDTYGDRLPYFGSGNVTQRP